MGRLRAYRLAASVALYTCAVALTVCSARNSWADSPARPPATFDSTAAANTGTDAAPPVVANIHTAVVHRETPSEGAIRAALRQPTEIDCDEMPFYDVTSYLRDKHNIEIQLDPKALAAAGIGTDTPVTRRLKGISLEEALALLLREFDMTAIVVHDVLLLTTNEAADNMVELRVYDVDDLIDDEDDAGDLAEMLNMLMFPNRLTSDGQAPGKMVIFPYKSLILARASIPAHEQLSRLLGEIRAKLDNDDD